MSLPSPQGLQGLDSILERPTPEIPISLLFQNTLQHPDHWMTREADLDLSLSQLDLPCHVLKRLHALGIKIVDELVQTMPEKLLSTPGFGRRSLHKVRVALKKYFGNHRSFGENSVDFLHKGFANNRLAHLESLYATCLTYESVGRRLGVRRQRVQQLMKFGQSIGVISKDLVRDMARLRKSQREKQFALQFPREALMQDYTALGSIRMVAKKYGVSRYALSKLLKFHKLTLSNLKKISGR